MAKYQNVKIHTSELGPRIILEDVDNEDSINPRSTINLKYVDEYQESIIDYLADDQEFSKVWRQTPEAVETDTEGVYLLISGYHTITALRNAISEIEKNPEKPIDKSDNKTLGDIDINFDIMIRVYPAGKYEYRETARYLAAFSNIHGQPLTQGEKMQAAYNALSTMNLTKDENDEAFRPHMNDRKLGAMIGIGKSTVWNQRSRLIQERFGKVEANQDSAEEDVSATLDELEAGVTETKSQDENEITEVSTERHDDADTADNSVPTGGEGLNIPVTDVKEEKEDKNGFGLKKASEVEFRKGINYCLELDADTLATAYRNVSSNLDKTREKWANLNMQDPVMGACVDRIFSLMITTIESLGDENDDRS